MNKLIQLVYFRDQLVGLDTAGNLWLIDMTNMTGPVLHLISHGIWN